MLEGTIQLGEALLRPDNVISNLILELQPRKNNKPLNVLKIKFNLEDGEVEIDVDEEMDEKTAEKYLYVGSADGPNSPQWYVSSTSMNYHLTETIYNLSNIDFGEELNNKIKHIFDNYYVDFKEDLKPKYRYALDLNKIGITDITMTELYEKVKKEVTNEKDVGKKLLDELKKSFEEYLKKELNTRFSNIGLYTIYIDDKPFSQFKEYKDVVVESKRPKSKKGNNIGICSVCGTNKDVSDDMTKMKIKYYTTNQVIFASGINKKSYYKNMQMCSNCMFKYLTGENYIINNMKTKLAAFDVYVVPQFVYGQPLDEVELNLASKEIMDSFNTVKSAEGLEKLRDEIEGSLDLKNEKSYFLLNFIFYKSSQQATKIQRMIKDVNPSIFEKIRIASNNAKNDFNSILGFNFKGTITLSSIYFMTPIRLDKKGDAAQYRDVLGIYDAVLTQNKLNRIHLINNLIECIRIIRYSKGSYNINPEKQSLEFYILTANMYLRFLEYLGCLKEGESLDVLSLKIKDHIKNYIEKVGYGEQETAVFLLGYLIGEIGNVQYKKPGSEGNKPILNKINFNGLDRLKIIRLTNDVFNKINQEKIRSFNEVTFFEMKKLLDANINNWKLNKDESLFYLLSGYSYATTLPMLREGDSK